jgi:hypothetical protein
MTVSAIEVVVGELADPSGTQRLLSYRVSFKDDAGEERLHERQSLVPEASLNDPSAIGRALAVAVSELLAEFRQDNPLLPRPDSTSSFRRASDAFL